MDITPYLQLMIEKKASDIFFSPGSPVRMKIDGKLISVGKNAITAQMVDEAVVGVMPSHVRDEFEQNWDVDFGYYSGNMPGRFRVNAFRQRGVASMVLRYLPADIPPLSDLGLPEVLGEMMVIKNGLVLVVGSTGSGKSTTIAAMLEHRNVTKSGHILTIEDPVEFAFVSKRCLVSQREVGHDTRSYSVALRAAMREAPDIILVGEIRDRETMEAALELCNTGHLCVSTMHANNANQAMDRIVNLFPETAQRQLYMDLSMNLRAVVSQRLVTSVEGGRCAAVEVLTVTPHISQLVHDGEFGQLREAMRDSKGKGMQTFDEALYNLYKEKRISLDEALGNADSRADLEARVNFG